MKESHSHRARIKLYFSILILILFTRNEISSNTQFPINTSTENHSYFALSNNSNNNQSDNINLEQKEYKFIENASTLNSTQNSSTNANKSLKLSETTVLVGGETLFNAFQNFSFTDDPRTFQHLYNDSASPEELFSINNYTVFNYTYYPESSKFSKTFLNLKEIDGNEYPVFTKADFLSESTSKNFTFNLFQNFKAFLGDFFPKFNSTSSLRSSQTYRDFISKSFKKKTILIGIDGLAPVCLEWNDYPFFKFLMANGAYTTKARSTSESVSAPGWSTILCSLNSEQTGIVDNNWKSPWLGEGQRKAYSWATPVYGLDHPFPCIMDELKRKSNGKIKTAFYSSWEFFHENFGNKARPGSVDVYVECLISKYYNFYEWPNCDEFSLERSKNFLLGDVDFYFWYMSSLDIQGHKDSFCSSSYFGRLEILINYLMEFFEFMKALNLEDKVNIIITSDHGADRLRFSHGNDYTNDNLLVPLFMIGPDFKQNYEIKESVSIDDIAPTIADLHNVTPNGVWTGKPLRQALKRFQVKQDAVEVLAENKPFLVSGAQAPFYLRFRFGFNNEFDFRFGKIIFVLVLLLGILF